MDLTLRDGIHLQEAISNAKQISEQSKAAGFYQGTLDHVARQRYGNASFEVGGEEGLDIVEEFYSDVSDQQTQDTPNQDGRAGYPERVAAISAGFELRVNILNDF